MFTRSAFRTDPNFQGAPATLRSMSLNGKRISAELIGILAVGVALAGLMFTQYGSLNARIDTLDTRMATRMSALENRMSAIEQRQARLEGLIEGAFRLNRTDDK